MNKNKLREILEDKEMFNTLAKIHKELTTENKFDFLGNKKNYSQKEMTVLNLLEKDEIIEVKETETENYYEYEILEKKKNKPKKHVWVLKGQNVRLKEEDINNFLEQFPEEVLEGCVKILDNWKLAKRITKSSATDFNQMSPNISNLTKSRGWVLENYAKQRGCEIVHLTKSYQENKEEIHKEKEKNVKKRELALETDNVDIDNFDLIMGEFLE